jgi:hypothetical protein
MSLSGFSSWRYLQLASQSPSVQFSKNSSAISLEVELYSGRKEKSDMTFIRLRWFKTLLYTKIFLVVFLLCYPHHLLSDSALNLGPLISRWETNKFKNCWYKSVRIFKVLKLLFQQFLNLSSSQQHTRMSGPILGHLSNNRWSREVRDITAWPVQLNLPSHINSWPYC